MNQLILITIILLIRYKQLVQLRRRRYVKLSTPNLRMYIKLTCAVLVKVQQAKFELQTTLCCIVMNLFFDEIKHFVTILLIVQVCLVVHLLVTCGKWDYLRCRECLYTHERANFPIELPNGDYAKRWCQVLMLKCRLQAHLRYEILRLLLLLLKLLRILF